MRGADRPVLIIYISVTKTWRCRSWIVTEPSFSNNSLRGDCLLWCLVLYSPLMKPAYFPIIVKTAMHPNYWTEIKLQL